MRVQGAVVAIAGSKGDAVAVRDELPAGVFVEIYPESVDDNAAFGYASAAQAALSPRPSSGCSGNEAPRTSPQVKARKA